MLDYGRAIRVARAARRLSQKGLAELSGLDASYISLLESGRRQPGADAIARLVSALRVPSHLLSLLAAPKAELEAASPEQVPVLGRLLLDLLISGEADDNVSDDRSDRQP